jgi:rubrerythrin
MNKIAFECPAKIFPVWSQMEAEGFETRVVGGFVRDMIMGHTPKDMDFCTTMTPEQMIDFAGRNGFRVEPTGMQHGTVSFIVDGEAFEFTTLRVDTDCDGRHATVQFTTDFEADAARRDFTFNAMSMDIAGNVHDFFGGERDAHNRVVRFVGSADERIAEDFLRVMRFFRFAARFETEMDMEACRAFTNPAVHAGLAKVSRERVWAEVSKMMSAPRPQRAVEMMFATGVAHAVGMGVNEFAHRAMTHGDDHCARMVGFCGDDVVGFCRDMKVSNEEQRKMVFVTRHAGKVTKSQFAGMMIDGEKQSHMVSVAKMTDPSWMEMMDKPVPVFPVTGQMLMDSGMKPGAQMGQVLKAMREAWKAEMVKEMVR